MGRQGLWAAAASAAVALLSSVAGASPVSAATHAACDRACLREALDAYLAAIVAHRPAGAPLAASFRQTENAVDTAPGQGLWATTTGYGPVQRRYFDPVSGEAAYYGTLAEGDDVDIVSLRLKVEGRKITEAEWAVARKRYGGMMSLDGLLAHQPPPDSPLPRAERTPRTKMIAAADSYFQGLQDHDGSNVPHVSGCPRVENGVEVTNRTGPPPPPPPSADGSAPQIAAMGPPGAGPGPGGQAGQPGLAQEMRSGDCVAGFDRFAHSIAETSHRRYPVVDEEAGVVLGETLFHRPPGMTMKRNLLSEYFWEKKGKISSIYAAMYYLDPAAPDTPGW